MPVTFLAVFSQLRRLWCIQCLWLSAKQVEYYLQAASEVNEKYGLEVKWQEILALDTVLLGQNFSQSSVERAKRLAAEFVQKEVVETEEVEAKVNVLYKQVLDKVMVAYRLSSEQKDQVSLFLKMIGSRGLVSDVIPDGWVPSGRGQFIWPLPKGQYTITSLFGPRVLNGVAGFHRGLDMGAPQGTPILRLQMVQLSTAVGLGKRAGQLLFGMPVSLRPAIIISARINVSRTNSKTGYGNWPGWFNRK